MSAWAWVMLVVGASVLVAGFLLEVGLVAVDSAAMLRGEVEDEGSGPG